MTPRRFTRGQWVRCPSGLVAMVHGYAGDYDRTGPNTIVLLSTDPDSGTWQQIAPEGALEPLVTPEPEPQATVNPNAGITPAFPKGRWT